MANTTAIESVANDLPDFEKLVRMHQRMVFNIAYHFLHDRALAEEVAQDVFLRLSRSLPLMKSEAHVNAWLCKVTTRRCIDYARRRRRDLALDEIPEPACESSPGDPLMGRRLQRMVASLPPKARAVVILRYQEELEPEEIAQVLGWRLNTVKSQLHRSLVVLRNKLGRSLGEAES